MRVTGVSCSALLALGGSSGITEVSREEQM